MSRRLLVAALVVAGLGLAACSGSSGPHTQSLSPTDPSSTVAASSSSATTGVPSSSSSRPSSGTVPTPTVTPPAQGAVDTFITFYNALTAADRDPAHASLASINRYLTGKALTLFDGIITNQAKAHLAYRGSPDDPRVRVGQIINASFLFLTSCPQPSKSDPFVQYDVRTGKAVKVNEPTQNVERLIYMKRASGRWKVFNVTAGNKKCTG